MINLLLQIDANSTIDVFLKYGLSGAMLVVAIAGLYLQDKSHKKERKELTDRVSKVVDDHKEDLKEAGKDMQVILDKYHAFANEIKDIVRPLRP
jgi:gas vesicle protein